MFRQIPAFRAMTRRTVRTELERVRDSLKAIQDTSFFSDDEQLNATLKNCTEGVMLLEHRLTREHLIDVERGIKEFNKTANNKRVWDRDALPSDPSGSAASAKRAYPDETNNTPEIPAPPKRLRLSSTTTNQVSPPRRSSRVRLQRQTAQSKPAVSDEREAEATPSQDVPPSQSTQLNPAAESCEEVAHPESNVDSTATPPAEPCNASLPVPLTRDTTIINATPSSSAVGLQTPPRSNPSWRRRTLQREYAFANQQDLFRDYHLAAVHPSQRSHPYANAQGLRRRRLQREYAFVVHRDDTEGLDEAVRNAAVLPKERPSAWSDDETDYEDYESVDTEIEEEDETMD